MELNMWEKKDVAILQEFGWRVDEMATAIRELRDEIEKKDKEIEELNNKE